MVNSRFRKIILLIVDIFLLHASLFITLTIRYGEFPNKKLWDIHEIPFLFLYGIWILMFFISGLYDIEKFISSSSLRTRVFKTMATAGALTILMFYFVPSFIITPKTNLFINVIVAFLLIWGWRKIFFNSLRKGSKITVYFLGKSKEIDDFAILINNNPQFGYKTTDEISSANIIIVSEQIKQNSELTQLLYEMMLSGMTVINFDTFYESVTGKIHVYMINKVWFLDNLKEIKKQGFEKFKRIFDIIFSLILFIFLIILYPLVSLAIKINSKGSVFYKQKRVGQNGKIFEIIKFRSMRADAETNGAQWAKKKDDRVTFVGNILRKTRIDELPQIWNILRGDLSLVGPRPERPEFIEELNEKIPHYSMRHLIKPGLSGWAQINFPYGASIEDSTEKLQYDLFYIKNRSILLELSILLKTIMVIVQHSGR